MANFALVTAPILPLQTGIATWPGRGSIVVASQKTRPFWFDGRFLAAHDLQRDQICFLEHQATLGRAAGFSVIHGLMVERVGSPADAETFLIRAGQGLTPGGAPVMIPSDLTVRISDLAEEESLGVQFGISRVPAPVARTRTGLYVIALRPVQFSANPVPSYPTSVGATPIVHDGDVVEATAVSLVPYPIPSSNYEAATQNAAVARDVFVAGSPGRLSDSLLPLAMISIRNGAIEWLDCRLVRRESGPEFPDLRFGLSDPAAEQAFLLQYDAQLQQVVAASGGPPAPFAATKYFQALPPAGRFPFASISVTNLTQLFFPPQTDVRLAVVPEDELPALLEESMALAPIDLSQAASAYADLSVLMLVPVARARFATFAKLGQVSLTAALPQVLDHRQPIELLRFYHGTVIGRRATSPWQQAIGTQVYGYYIRRRSTPVFVAPQQATTNTTTLLTATPIKGYAAATLAAAVTPSSATGTVTFMEGAKALGTVDLTTGTATLAMPLAAGVHTLTATYNGDANFLISKSGPVSVTTT
jgi:hypothetical protein